MIEIITGVALFLIGLLCVLLWNFSKGPVDITFAAQHVRTALISDDTSNNLKFDSIVAKWPDFSGPISIHMTNVILTQDGYDMLTIPELGVRIAKLPLLIGMIKPEAIVATDPTLRLVRNKDGNIHLFLSEMANINNEHIITNKNNTSIAIKELGNSFFKGGTLPDYPVLEPLSQLENFIIKSAQISVEDLATGKKWLIPDLNFDVFRHENNFDMNFYYTEDNGANSSLVLGIKKEKDTANINLSGDLHHINVTTWAKFFLPPAHLENKNLIVDGNLNGKLNNEWQLQNFNADIASDKGNITIKRMKNLPLTFSNFAANINFSKDKNLLSLSNTHLNINGREISLSGERTITNKDAIYPIRINIPEFSFSEIQALWPDNAKDTILADWLLKRLSNGVINNFELNLPIDLNNPDLIDITKIDAKFDYDHLDTDYRAPLIKATNAKGNATIKDDILTININSGKIADLNIGSSSVKITQLTHPKNIGNVIVDVDVSGELKTFIEYIGLNPINLSSKLPFKANDIKGIAKTNVVVTFPAVKDLSMDAVKVSVAAEVNNVLLPKITKGLDLTGNYNLKFNSDKFTLNGNGKLDGKDINLEYTTYFNPEISQYLSTIKAKSFADKSIRNAFGLDIEQFVSGTVPIDIDYHENKDGKEQVLINADLTPAIFQITPLGYKKNIGKNGKLSANVLVGNGKVINIKDLNVAINGDGGFKGNLDFGMVGKNNDVRSAVFKTVTLGGYNNFSLNLTQDKPKSYKININGKKFDAKNYTGKSLTSIDTNNNNQPIPTMVDVKIKADNLKTGNLPDQLLNQAQINFSTNFKNEITVLNINGKLKNGDFLMSLKPDQNGKMALKINSSNAGEALYAMDIYKDMVGGKLDVTGIQYGSGLNDIYGRIIITDYAVVHAPILAKLINLLSLSGLGELLQNKGIAFDKMRANFSWINTGDMRKIYLRDGRMSGASLGLTFGGEINQTQSVVDISGTFVPMSQINGFLNKIPIIGNLLTGGKNGGVIAATYSVKGDSQNPNVLLNPLSVLAPGFLRTIIFGGNNDDDTKYINIPKSVKGYNN